MKKLILLIFIFCIFGLVVMPVDGQMASNVFGDAISKLDEGGKEAFGVTSEPNLPKQIGQIINMVLGVLGIVLLIVLIRGGLLYMTAGGTTEQVTKAKAWLINGIIGLVITMLAYAISSYVVNRISTATTGSSLDSQYANTLVLK